MRNWHVTETTFDPQALHHKETVFTIGNGYLGTRGAFEEGYPGEQAITLVHGLFDDVPVVHTELVNAPNWLDFIVSIAGERFHMDCGTVLDYRRDLDLRTGVLTRTVRWQSPAGHTLDIVFERFASLADEHVLGIRCRVTSVDFSGAVEFRAGVSGHVDNDGFQHWEWLAQGAIEGYAYLEVRTKSTHLDLCEACHLTLSDGAETAHIFQDGPWSPTLIVRAILHPGETVTADKLVTIFSARDTAEPRAAALHSLADATAQGYDALRVASDAAWVAEWEASNITIEGDDEADLALRYSLFQLLIAAPRHDDRVSIAAKSLSGLGYRGHVFWDTETFVLPFFSYTRPEIARNMLLYRYHTLAGARRKAQENGCEGAMYAWESAATGDETTPRWGITADGEQVRIWCGEIELHITADVAYAVHQYWRVTGDDAFMRDYGAEIILDTARFWASRAEWHGERDRYEINDVIGPDEYHDHVDNNVYTNRMACWNLETALELLVWLRQESAEKAGDLEQQLDLTDERLAQWRDVIARLYIPHAPEGGLLEQFEGFFALKDISLADYEPRDCSMYDILGMEGMQECQVLKQPDVLMLMYLLTEHYDEETIAVNWDYYTPRTDLTYGSSLGPAIQAALAAQQGRVEEAYRHFLLAGRTDLQDARGNTGEGIHAATLGGLWQAAVFGFGGIRLTDEGPIANPRLPAGWKRLKFRIQYRGRWYDFDL